MLTKQRYLQTGFVTNTEKELKVEGVWWLPSDPNNKIFGILHINPESGISLILRGTFRKEDKELKDFDIILGKQSSGHQITLTKCIESKRKDPFISDGYIVEFYHVESAVSGVHFESLDEVFFDKIRINFTYLKDWFRNVGLDFKKENNKYIVEYKKDKFSTVESLTARTDIGTISFKNFPVYSDNVGIENEIKIGINEHIEIKLNEGKNISTLVEETIYPIRDFLNLATCRPNTVNSFYAYPIGMDDVKEKRLNETQIFTEFDTPRIERKSLFNLGVILFLAKDIEPDFDAYFNNWLKFYKAYPDITQLFFSVHYNNRMHPTNRFLNVIQALESYHRARKGKHKIPKKNHNERCQKVYDSVSDELKEWLVKVLPNSNRKSVKDRVREMVEESDPISKKLIQNTKSFSQWTRDTRNWYTHLDEGTKGKVAEGDNLILLTFSLIWLIRIQFLKEIGFSNNNLVEILEENDEFKIICDSNKKNVPWK